MTSLLWLRRDLRRADHPALGAAAKDGPVVVAFVVDPAVWTAAGAARRAWLATTLRATAAAYDGRLVLRLGDPRDVVPALAREVGVRSVHVSRETTPFGRRRDAVVQEALRATGVAWVETGSPYAVSPGLVRTGDGGPYRVFTPFSRAWARHGWPEPAPEPAGLRLADVPSDPRAWAVVGDAASAAGPVLPPAGEAAALRRWSEFLDEGLAAYEEERDRPDLDGTSRMSAYLTLGVVHPRTLLADLAERRGPGPERFRTELAWREFYADVLWHRPDSAWSDLRTTLRHLEYDDADEAQTAWREGRTGFPFVDAGMRQLAATGWMHNRLRMVTASFFTKDLHGSWPAGARHFLDHLIDGDIASNNQGWQWVAGTGADASPYFRVFNPVRQGVAHDPEGDFVRRWVPELRHLAGPAAHEPWRQDDGYAHGYPRRIVDHDAERLDALRRYRQVPA